MLTMDITPLDAPLLPEEFSSLEPFVSAWAFPTELQRSQQRWAAGPDDYRAFYEAMLPVLDQVLDFLDNYQAGAIPEQVLPLYHLVLAFAEAAPHNELYDCSNTIPNSFAAHRFVASHGEVIDR